LPRRCSSNIHYASAIAVDAGSSLYQETCRRVTNRVPAPQPSPYGPSVAKHKSRKDRKHRRSSQTNCTSGRTLPSASEFNNASDAPSTPSTTNLPASGKAVKASVSGVRFANPSEEWTSTKASNTPAIKPDYTQKPWNFMPKSSSCKTLMNFEQPLGEVTALNKTPEVDEAPAVFLFYEPAEVNFFLMVS